MPSQKKPSTEKPLTITKIIPKQTAAQAAVNEDNTATIGFSEEKEAPTVEVSNPIAPTVETPSNTTEVNPITSSVAAVEANTTATVPKTKANKSQKVHSEATAATSNTATTSDSAILEPQTPTTLSATTVKETSISIATDTTSEQTTTDNPPKQPKTHPISDPTQHLQYRAIGLIKGKFVPVSKKNREKGTLVTIDGTEIDALILPRLKTVVRKYLNLDEEHLWIVYPRTPGVNATKASPKNASVDTTATTEEQEKSENPVPTTQEDPSTATEDVTTVTQEHQNESTTEVAPEKQLHVQIVGVWEPQTLHPDMNLPTPEPQLQPDTFSVRGEVMFQNATEGWLVVKIVQKQKPEETKPKYIKLQLFGLLEQKAVKQFWDFSVLRQDEKLVIQDALMLANFAKPKKPPFNKNKKNFNNLRHSGQRPPLPHGQRPAGQSVPKPKPVKK